MYAATFDTDTRSDGVDAVIVGFDSHFGPFARGADDVADGDKAVVDFGYFGFQQTFEKDWGGTGKDDDRVVVFEFDFQHDGADGVAFAEMVGRDLLAFGENEFDFFLIEDEDFLVPGLIDFANDDFTDFFFIFLEDERLLVVLDFADEVLTDGED